jgi:hypothetical protein
MGPGNALIAPIDLDGNSLTRTAGNGATLPSADAFV